MPVPYYLKSEIDKILRKYIDLSENGELTILQTDDDLYIDENGIIRNNITDIVETLNYNSEINSDKTFPLINNPVDIRHVFVEGIRIFELTDYQFIEPNIIKITKEINNGDRINVDYQHFVVEPEN